jgi:hypothetical protein
MNLGFIPHVSRPSRRRSWPPAVLTLATFVVSAVLAAPAMAAPPTVTGTPEQGMTLAWTNSTNLMPTSTQWMRCSPSATCTPIPNQTGVSYTLTADDVGSQIEVSDIMGNSPPTAVVFPILLAPVIAGSRAEGQTLQAVPQWSATPPPGATPFTFSWSRCVRSNCTAVPGVTGNQYKLSAADVGSTIQVALGETEPSGAAQNASAATGSIAAAAASTTSIAASPTSATTNQGVTLIATVTATVSGKSPTGTIAFANRGATIQGCGSVPASGPGQSVTVTCTATFPAASSPEQLTAAFTPAAGSAVTGSSSMPASMTIRRDSTTSSVDVSNPTVALGRTATYTANIQGTLTGSVKPSGTVEFFDGGKPIAACTTRPLSTTTVSSQASCVVRSGHSGSHSITIAYPGDANFVGSGSSSSTRVTVRAISLGTVNSTMQWSFGFTHSYTRVLALLVDSASAGTSVVVRCQGGGCPFAKRSTMVHQTTRCPTKGTGTGTGKSKGKGKSKCTTRRSSSVDLEPGFRSRRLRGGARITIFLMRPQWVGKYYQFAFRTDAAPRIRIACLAPGSTAPGVGC